MSELRKGVCLVVEDDPVLRRIVRTHLTRSGVEVLVACSVAEAIERLRTHEVCYILSDAYLPDGSVLELLSSLAELGRAPAVVVMSGDREMARAVEAARCGIGDFLLKPFAMHELDAALSRACALSGLCLLRPAAGSERVTPEELIDENVLRRKVT
jgi:DNA-binding NtrC family response regulator